MFVTNPYQRWQRPLIACTIVMATLCAPVEGQEYGARLGNVQRGGKVSFEPTGPGVIFDAMDPTLRKWYVPQELYAEYRWNQWEYANYARQPYQRYVSSSIEGQYFYDVYGNYLTQGWLVYDWREENPQVAGSSLLKTGQYSGFFNRLVVASDHKGQYHYAITVGDEIRTTLTPMTFSKPKFNGLQWDFSSDKYDATLLLSRIGAPSQEQFTFFGGDRRTDITNMVGGRVEAQVGDFAKIGGTLVSSYQANTQTGSFGGDMFRGNLSASQNFNNVTVVEVRISDDSPFDNESGGSLFAADILIRDIDGVEIRGSEIGFRPETEGGFQRAGYLAADGNQQIVLRYDFGARNYRGPDPNDIDRVQIELVIANDYFVEITSNRQTGRNGDFVYLPVVRANGNVKDSSNQRVLRFDYGLPTANQILGFSIEIDNLAGFRAYGEVDINRRYRQYPNLNLATHHTADARSDVWLFNLSRSHRPIFFFAEGFSIPHDYTTSMGLLNIDGDPTYGSEFWNYEFVEDNDDQDQFADWSRRGSGNQDREVFPGWDENNDFISDFNQNDNEDSPNLIPDYEEPFLRYAVDRPEYLFGVDMNHNQWIDRFENDEEPDYPYQRDRQGFNIFAGTFLGPDGRLTLGRLSIHQPSRNRRSKASYVLLTLDRDWPRVGRLRIFQDLRRVRDNIADDLFQWVQEPNTRGNQRLVQDVLPAQDTWINATYLGVDFDALPGLRLINKFKGQFYLQMGSDDEVELRRTRRRSYFLGVIDKAEYRFLLGNISLIPRWKSEFRREAPVALDLPRRIELSQLGMFLVRRPFLRSSFLEVGVEYHWFNQLIEPTPPGAEDDYHGMVLSTQWTNLSAYQGYRLTTTIGLEIDRRSYADQENQTQTRGFTTIYAGIDR